VQTPDGQTALTRDGHLGVGNDGALQVGDNRLATTMRLPPGSTNAYVDPTGQVHVQAATGDQVLGKLPLARIANPEELTALGSGLFQPSTDSGAIQPVVPGDLTGLANGAVEGSNVQVDQELTHMMRAQRAYQANAQMIHTWDELASQTISDMGRV
jgi:flagellar basal-body rod protein FlgG